MFRFVFRLMGFVLLAAAFAALIVDGTRSIAAKQLLPYSFGDTAAWMFPTKLAALRLAFDHGTLQALRPLLTGVLSVPTWLVTGVLGCLLLLAGRRPPPKIGYSGRR